jgi:hypothetical protein
MYPESILVEFASDLVELVVSEFALLWGRLLCSAEVLGCCVNSTSGTPFLFLNSNQRVPIRSRRTKSI